MGGPWWTVWRAAGAWGEGHGPPARETRLPSSSAPTKASSKKGSSSPGRKCEHPTPKFDTADIQTTYKHARDNKSMKHKTLIFIICLRLALTVCFDTINTLKTKK